MIAPEAGHAAWTRYWQDGNCASCDNAEGTGSPEWAWDEWRRCFASCPPGGTIVDLGCGNGALLRRAASLPEWRQAGQRLLGFDLAEILTDPPLPGLRLLGGIAMENLPLSDASADIVVSQFALEYSDRERSIAELMRILRKGGRFLLLLHVGDSRIVQRASRQAAALEQLFASGLPQVLDGAMAAIAAAATDPVPRRLDMARSATLSLVAGIDALEYLRRDGEAGAIMSAALEAIRAAPRAFERMAPEQAIASARDLVERLAAQLARFRDLERAALSPHDLAKVTRWLEERGASDLVERAALAPEPGGASVRTGVWISGERSER